MAYRLFGVKVSPESILTYCKLCPKEQTSVKILSKFKYCLSRKAFEIFPAKLRQSCRDLNVLTISTRICISCSTWALNVLELSRTSSAQVLEMMQMHPKERLGQVILTANWFDNINMGYRFHTNTVCHRCCNNMMYISDENLDLSGSKIMSC